MFKLTVKVAINRFEEGKSEAFENDAYEVPLETETKFNLFCALMREFGRCYGSIPMGYKFGKKVTYANGNVGFEYANVTIISGARPNNGFILGEEG